MKRIGSLHLKAHTFEMEGEKGWSHSMRMLDEIWEMKNLTSPPCATGDQTPGGAVEFPSIIRKTIPIITSIASATRKLSGC
jgi:hypothetical protein